MWTLKLLAALAALCILAAPAPAQEVVSEPGYCAQFYPYANCQNKGPGNPYTGSYQRGFQGGGMWPGEQVIVVPRRMRPHRSYR